MTTFLDTNVLAYQFDSSFPAKQQRARDILIEHAADGVVSTQVLIELHSVLTKKLGQSREDASIVLSALHLEVIATDAPLVLRAAETSARHELSIFDALILEAAAHAGCDQLFTEDLADGSTLRGISIVNPFRDL